MRGRKDLAFPLRRSLARQHADADEHLRDMMAQVLFTLPGERLNLPDFGAGVQRLVFAPLSPETSHVTQLTVRTQLQRWLGEQLQVESVTVLELGSQLAIEVGYTRLGTNDHAVARFGL